MLGVFAASLNLLSNDDEIICARDCMCRALVFVYFL